MVTLNIARHFSNITKYLQRDLVTKPNAVKFEKLMNSSDNQLMFKVAKYCKIVLKTFHEIFRNI